jgi:hypothetical protein
MQIRLAHTTDAAAVNELLHQLCYAQDGAAATATRIQTWDDDLSGAAYVADADGKVLGLVAVHICPFFERAGSWGTAAKARTSSTGSAVTSTKQEVLPVPA